MAQDDLDDTEHADTAEPLNPSADEVPSESKYLVQTDYAYIYHADDGAIIGEIKLRAPKDLKTPKASEVPVVESRTIIYTGVRHGMTKTEMENFDNTKAVTVIVRITIHSPMVLNALRDIVRYYPGTNLGDQSLVN